MAPHDVPLIVGPLAEEVYDKGRIAVLGFGLRGQSGLAVRFVTVVFCVHLWA